MILAPMTIVCKVEKKNCFSSSIFLYRKVYNCYLFVCLKYFFFFLNKTHVVLNDSMKTIKRNKS